METRESGEQDREEKRERKTAEELLRRDGTMLHLGGSSRGEDPQFSSWGALRFRHRPFLNRHCRIRQLPRLPDRHRYISRGGREREGGREGGREGERRREGGRERDGGKEREGGREREGGERETEGGRRLTWTRRGRQLDLI